MLLEETEISAKTFSCELHDQPTEFGAPFGIYLAAEYKDGKRFPERVSPSQSTLMFRFFGWAGAEDCCDAFPDRG